MMMSPQCNHDLGVLLRICNLTSDADPSEARESLIEAIGDHEYYASSYASKEQPHTEGLLVTLAQSVRYKEEDIAKKTAEGQ